MLVGHGMANLLTLHCPRLYFLMDKNLSLWEQYKKNLGDSRPWHVIHKENYVEEDIANKRFLICQQCPDFFKPLQTCKKCGCLMKAKTKLKNASCPINKW